MPDAETLSVYDQRVEEYAQAFQGKRPDPDLVRFMAHVAEGGFVLDLGCGPARASAIMREAGLRVDPVDASQGMVELANRQHAIGARLATFDDLEAVDAYDGVWANFSLLHAPRDRFRDHLAAIFAALKPGGWFHIGMKTGTGERRDRLGRFYTFYGEAELAALLEAAGFGVAAQSRGRDKGLAGTLDPWVTMLAQKPG